MKASAVIGAACFTGIFLAAQNSLAVTDLLRAWQEFEGDAHTASGPTTPGASRISKIGAAVPGARSLSCFAITPGNSASAAGNQSGVLNGETFSFSGGIDLHVTSVFVGYASMQVRQVFEFDVLSSAESVTISVGQVSVSGNHSGFSFLIYNRATGQPVVISSGEINVTNVFLLQPGEYRYQSICSGLQDVTGDTTCSYQNTITFSNLLFQPGSSQINPILPVDGLFPDAPNGVWFDPPAVSEFSFQMTSNVLFTGIFNFPTGFTNAFEVLAEGASLGMFTTNQSVDFVDLVGHGVSAFRVRNIAPLVDGGSPVAFPIQLGFSADTASFVMLPNPGLKMMPGTNGQSLIYFAGALEQSTNLVDWADVPGPPASPLVMPQSQAQLFFRTRQE